MKTGKWVGIAVVLVGSATVGVAGILGKQFVFEFAEEWYYTQKYGSMIYTDFYEIHDLCPLAHFKTPIIGLGDVEIEPCDPERCDCHLRIDVQELLASVGRILFDEEGHLVGEEPKIQGGKLMAITTFLNHLKIKRLLGKLREGPTPTAAMKKIQGASQ